MSDEKIIRNLRSMAWERAKGELKSMLHCFWSSADHYEELRCEIDKFIKRVEDYGLHE